MNSVQALRALSTLDWDFVVPRKGYVAPLHWYPGTFVRGLSNAVIQALTKPGDIVFDPYGGIGTTACSAVLNARSFYSIDMNPVASMVAYVSSAVLLMSAQNPNALGRCFEALEQISAGSAVESQVALPYSPPNLSDVDGVCAAVLTPSPNAFLEKSLSPSSPNWEALEVWIAPKTLAAIRSTYDRSQSSDCALLRVLALCMLSATVRSASSQHASWGHIADNVRPKELVERDAPTLAKRWIVNARRFSALAVTTRVHDHPISGAVLAGDSSVIAPSEPADLLLTSPPYAGAIDYVLAQRLSLYLLGRSDTDLAGLVKGELGARRKRFLSTSRADWSDTLSEAVVFQQGAIKPEGAICLVLPHKDSGRSSGEDSIKARLNGLGWDTIYSVDRSIHQSHTRQSWTSIKKETMIFFMRG